MDATVSAYFVTENSENTFPALSVRAGENVFVRFSTFQDSAAYENYVAALSQSKRWRGEVSGGLALYLNRAPEEFKALTHRPLAIALIYQRGRQRRMRNKN